MTGYPFVVWLNTLGFGDGSILSNSLLQLLDLIDVVGNCSEHCLDEVIWERISGDTNPQKVSHFL